MKSCKRWKWDDLSEAQCHLSDRGDGLQCITAPKPPVRLDSSDVKLAKLNIFIQLTDICQTTLKLYIYDYCKTKIAFNQPMDAYNFASAGSSYMK